MWDIRGLGAMLAVEFVTDFDSAAPDAALAKAVIGNALKRGLILLGCGMHGNAIRSRCCSPRPTRSSTRASPSSRRNRPTPRRRGGGCGTIGTRHDRGRTARPVPAPP
ncbi:MAG: hypothetical protein R3D80_05375 [Paracoccaceae bacterium]